MPTSHDRDRSGSPRRTLGWSRAAPLLGVTLVSGAALGATTAPPMLDITRQCDVQSRHNVTAMSECVVAESEARSELLQKWERLSDASVQKCIKIGRKARRQPYTAMAKCLSVEQVDVRPPPEKPADPPPTAPTCSLARKMIGLCTSN